MSRIRQFGEEVAGYSIPVLNEREIRAAAGMLFLLMFVSIQRAASVGDFVLLKYAVVLFLTDISIRIFINPKFSPTLIMGRFFVRNQVPEYVGAQQKIFAWRIGFALASIMFVLLIVVNTYSPITGLICFICLIFLFFEAVFGICLGCKFYSMLYKEKAQYCPGEVCDLKSKQEIQIISKIQIIIVVAFIAFMWLTILLFNDIFVEPPYDLFGLESAMH
ncbi:MAG: DUF4395 domain-containing protein [Candidatus Marinimicrobia bacterium]|nr:DUF4395 domain-containing protein [Candidatus Neomarinimicrobiota bacterium]